MTKEEAKARGFAEVGREDFYAAVGPTNVSPRPAGARYGTPEYRSEWVTPDGTVVGLTYPTCRYDGTPPYAYLLKGRSP